MLVYKNKIEMHYKKLAIFFKNKEKKPKNIKKIN